MLVIDDTMLKLARMQEAVLEVSTDSNRYANLEKYKNTVMEIDKQAFSSLLDELSQVNEHNRTLEEESQFLEQVKSYYDQLNELQLSFKRVCELYGDDNLRLSDLSQINIEYIENRINTINGYLINLKNIDGNKVKLQELNEQLISEERNKEFLSKKLLEFECLLRENFADAEGRIMVDGQLQYVSVVSEYQKLGYDFKALLVDESTLDSLLSAVNVERLEVEEKLKTAEICYNTNPNADSKQILDEISKEFLRVRYRLTMLKMLKILSQNYDDYDLFKEKREKILDLIKYRVACLDKLGIRISIDPFGRIKVSEQLTMISSLTDNSKVINRIKKDIAQLSERVDEMIHQNDDYMMSINDVEELLISKTRISDIDISGISLDIGDYVDTKTVMDNQVIGVREIPVGLNMLIVRQKTNGVIKRVNEMVATTVVDDREEVSTPELVIVPQDPVIDREFEAKISENLFDDLDASFSSKTDGTLDDKVVLGQEVDKPVLESTLSYNSDIFETVDPFAPTPLFTDRSDESFVDTKSSPDDVFPSLDLEFFPKKEEPELMLQLDNNDLNTALPDAFWVTQGDESDDEELDGEETDDVVLSFDEQIKALLKDDTKVKKLVA